MAMPPMLRWTLVRVPFRTDEKERLIREEIEAKAFIPNLERLLLTVDESPNGKFAAQLAGLIAGSRRLPTTVLSLPQKKLASNGTSNGHTNLAPDETKSSALVLAAAHSIPHADKEDMSLKPADITVRTIELFSPDAVASEAKKGYGLLIIGIGNTREKSGEFHPDLAHIVSAFEGPVAIVAGRDRQVTDPQRRLSSILVPESGTETVTARGGARDYARARLRVPGQRALCRPHRSRRPERPSTDSSRLAPSSTKSPRWASLWRENKDCGAHRCGAGSSHSDACKADEPRSAHHGCDPPSRRQAILRRYRSCGVRARAVPGFASGELTQAISFVFTPAAIRERAAELVGAGKPLGSQPSRIGAVTAPIGEFLERSEKARPAASVHESPSSALKVLSSQSPPSL